MNLIIDLGNTQTKLAVFANGELIEKWTSDPDSLLQVTGAIFDAYSQIHYTIVAAVGHFSKGFEKMLASRTTLFQLSQATKVPFVNLYETPTTLGVDRIALISAACERYPGEPVLVIDAGSCITYDFKDRNEQYLGGAISPGLRMRYKAVNHFTEKLPSLEPKRPEDFIGSSTNDSLHAGIVQGILNEMDGFIDSYNEKFQGLRTIFTGGDAHFLRDSLKNDIFANPNFLLEGLNYILEYNID